MKILVMALREDELQIFEKINEKYHFDIVFQQEQLTESNLELACNYQAVCINAGCKITEEMAKRLKGMGVEYILTRAAGKDHLNIPAIREAGLKSANVPAYSPNAISEHTVLLILSALRKLKKQIMTIQKQFFFIQGLRGKELRSMTVGVIGTGRIGTETVRNLTGFGCRILACDVHRNSYVETAAEYVTLEELLSRSDIVVLHCPMTQDNFHLIGSASISIMKEGAILINTARGALVDTREVYRALKNGRISAFAMDVYEFEDKTQRKDYRGKELDDELLKDLLAMDNVLFTSHTAFYTDEAIESIIDTTLHNLHEWETTGSCVNETYE